VSSGPHAHLVSAAGADVVPEPGRPWQTFPPRPDPLSHWATVPKSRPAPASRARGLRAHGAGPPCGRARRGDRASAAST